MSYILNFIPMRSVIIRSSILSCHNVNSSSVITNQQFVILIEIVVCAAKILVYFHTYGKNITLNNVRSVNK